MHVDSVTLHVTENLAAATVMILRARSLKSKYIIGEFCEHKMFD